MPEGIAHGITWHDYAPIWIIVIVGLCALYALYQGQTPDRR